MTATPPNDNQLLDPSSALDLGLAAAFGPVAGGGDDGVLAALGAGVNLAMRMLEPGEAGAESNLPGRYHLFGEIARGGMGVILQGRDNHLGRDVVFKVLREEHQDSAGLQQRFLEEARVGGQLQHPGIVPVYEMGKFADR